MEHLGSFDYQKVRSMIAKQPRSYSSDTYFHFLLIQNNLFLKYVLVTIPVFSLEMPASF